MVQNQLNPALYQSQITPAAAAYPAAGSLEEQLAAVQQQAMQQQIQAAQQAAVQQQQTQNHNAAAAASLIAAANSQINTQTTPAPPPPQPPSITTATEVTPANPNTVISSLPQTNKDPASITDPTISPTTAQNNNIAAAAASSTNPSSSVSIHMYSNSVFTNSTSPPNCDITDCGVQGKYQSSQSQEHFPFVVLCHLFS